jgi:hypothetical protein
MYNIELQVDKDGTTNQSTNRGGERSVTGSDLELRPKRVRLARCYHYRAT